MSLEWKGENCSIVWDDDDSHLVRFYTIEVRHGDASDAKRHIHRTRDNRAEFTYTFSRNVQDGGVNGPSRILNFRVQKTYLDGRTSEFTATPLRVVNPQMPEPNNVRFPGNNREEEYVVNFDPPESDSDYRETLVWVDRTALPFGDSEIDLDTDIAGDPFIKTQDNPIVINAPGGIHARVQVGFSDRFGEDNINRSEIGIAFAHPNLSGTNTAGAGPGRLAYLSGVMDSVSNTVSSVGRVNGSYGQTLPDKITTDTTLNYRHSLVYAPLATGVLNIKSYNNSDATPAGYFRYRRENIQPNKLSFKIATTISHPLEDAFLVAAEHNDFVPNFNFALADAAGEGAGVIAEFEILNGDTVLTTVSASIPPMNFRAHKGTVLDEHGQQAPGHFAYAPPTASLDTSREDVGYVSGIGIAPTGWDCTFRIRFYNLGVGSGRRLINIRNIEIALAANSDLTLAFSGDNLLSMRMKSFQIKLRKHPTTVNDLPTIGTAASNFLVAGSPFTRAFMTFSDTAENHDLPGDL